MHSGWLDRFRSCPTLAGLDGWSDQLKKLLAGFIGHTEGIEIDFEIVGQPGIVLTAFVRDRRMIDGATFLLAAPRGTQIERALGSIEAATRVREYAAWHRAAGERPKRGLHAAAEDLSSIDTGLRVRHPLGGPALSVLVSAQSTHSLRPASRSATLRRASGTRSSPGATASQP